MFACPQTASEDMFMIASKFLLYSSKSFFFFSLLTEIGEIIELNDVPSIS